MSRKTLLSEIHAVGMRRRLVFETKTALPAVVIVPLREKIVPTG